MTGTTRERYGIVEFTRRWMWKAKGTLIETAHTDLEALQERVKPDDARYGVVELRYDAEPGRAITSMSLDHRGVWLEDAVYTRSPTQPLAPSPDAERRDSDESKNEVRAVAGWVPEHEAEAALGRAQGALSPDVYASIAQRCEPEIQLSQDGSCRLWRDEPHSVHLEPGQYLEQLIKRHVRSLSPPADSEGTSR